MGNNIFLILENNTILSQYVLILCELHLILYKGFLGLV